MAPMLFLAQYFGYDSIYLSGFIAGVTGGASVILFPDPKR